MGRKAQYTVGGLCFVLGMLWAVSLSVVSIGKGEIGLMNRVFGSDLPSGAVLARDSSQRGPQAEILGPGTDLIPFVNLWYEIDEAPWTEIPAGYYGILIAKDGAPMPEGSFLAPAFPAGRESEFLNAEVFLAEGGIKGPQLSVLTPGTYRLNPYLWEIRVDGPSSGSRGTSATVIPAGHVGVVKSNVAEPGKVCREVEEKVDVEGAPAAQVDSEVLSALLVPKGCVGIWKEVLPPGAYYLNNMAYDVTVVDTRVQTWEYAGGYTSKKIDLTVGQDGKIDQTATQDVVPVPEGAADSAINVKVGSWVVHQDLRLIVQISPDNAPIVVAAVGGSVEVENSIVTPSIQSVVRDVLGGVIEFPNEDGTVTRRPVEIQDLIQHRELLQTEIEKRIRIEAQKAGLSVREVKFANPDIPPEMLLGNKREQLADQLKQAYEQEQKAQEQRIQVEQAKATADQQPELVRAQIGVEVSQLTVQKRTNEGEAEKAYLVQIAEGQQAQVNVLGPDKVLMLNLFEKFLGTVSDHPDILGNLSNVKLPSTVVFGGGGLEGVAAVVNQGMKALQGSDTQK